MSLPSQTVALLQAARDLVKGLPADAVLLLPETALDWDEVGRLLGGCKLYVAAENPALIRPLHDHPDWTVIDLDAEPVPTQERMNNALLKAVTTGELQPGAHVVVLYNGINIGANLDAGAKLGADAKAKVAADAKAKLEQSAKAVTSLKVTPPKVDLSAKKSASASAKAGGGKADAKASAGFSFGTK